MNNLLLVCFPLFLLLIVFFLFKAVMSLIANVKTRWEDKDLNKKLSYNIFATVLFISFFIGVLSSWRYSAIIDYSGDFKNVNIPEIPFKDPCLQAVQGYNINDIWVSTTTQAGISISFPNSLSRDKKLVGYTDNYTLTNFEGAYLNGGIIPPNGVELVLSTTPNPTTSLDDFLAQQLKDASNVVKGRIIVDGKEARCISYNESFSPIEMHFVDVYIPSTNLTYKFSLAFNSGDHKEAEFLSMYKEILASVKLPKTAGLPRYETINGISVPPEPDQKINDSTLMGIDLNNNGVRDDVERKIARIYTIQQFNAIIPFAAKLQSGLVTLSTATTSDLQTAESLRLQTLIECARRVAEAAVPELNGEKDWFPTLADQIFNTSDRIKIYNIYALAVAEDDTKGVTCK